MEFSNTYGESSAFGDWLISPLEGEMGGSPEGGVSREIAKGAPPTALPGISPTRGEISSSYAFVITAETEADSAARDALLDRAMGPRWKKKSSHKLRRGRLPSPGLAFVARDEAGCVVGTVRLWDVTVNRAISPSRGEIGSGDATALLLGPLAVDPGCKSSGIGSALMRHAIAEAGRLGHRVILLVGDAPYYGRFGFTAEKTTHIAMPGPYERHRFLALEIEGGALDGVLGVLKAAGRKAPVVATSLAA